jgi:hypothetical protein
MTNVPIADVASSRISNLLCLTIALARAIICRCPTDRLPPPLAISESRVILFSSERRWREKRPAARRASFSVASSYWLKTSRLCRRVPLRSSGWTIWQMSYHRYHIRTKGYTHHLRNDSHIRAQSVEIQCIGRDTTVNDRSLCEDAAKKSKCKS